MDEKEEEETEVVGQSSMEELDYEASDNLEEESMEQQSDNNTSSNVNGATEETEMAAIGETDNELAAVTGEPDEPVVHSVEARAGSKGSQTDSKSGNDTGARKKSSDEKGRSGNGESKSSERRTNSVCKPCNLVFENHRWLDTHVKSGDHNHVVKGFKPSSGRYFCYLCWLGFQYTDMLAQHLTKSDHKARARRKGVYGPLLKPEELKSRGGDRSRSPVRVRLSDYYEVDSVGECDTRGARPRRLENRGKSPERKNDKEDKSSEKATKELAENVANNRAEDGAEQKEKSRDSSPSKNEGNNNESNGVNGACDDNPSIESNDLNAVRESKGEGGEETFTESEPTAVAICGS